MRTGPKREGTLGLLGRRLGALFAVTVLRRRPAAWHELPTVREVLGLLAVAPIRRGDRDHRPRAAGHPRIAFEHGTLVDDQGRCIDIGLNARGRAEDDRVGGIYVSVDVALDLDRAAVDGRRDLGPFADDQEVGGRDLAGERSVDTHLTLEVELALDHR